MAFARSGVMYFKWKEKEPGVWEGTWEGLIDGRMAKTTNTLRWLGPDEWHVSYKGVTNAPDTEQRVQRVEDGH